MAHSLKFNVGELLRTKSDPLKYISGALLFPYHYIRIGLSDDDVAYPHDIEPNMTYLCIEPAQCIKGEYRKMVRILTNNGPKWCFASCFIRKRH